jgi:uncharacterized protein
MQQPHHYKIRDQNCWLSPQRMLFWEEEKALVVSDLHFGKTGHFRKSGIAVPQSVYKEDLQRLVSQLQYFNPSKLLVVGDMFHSLENRELDWFKRWRADFSHIAIELIKGNHDILNNEWYNALSINIHTEELEMAPFRFCHDLENAPPRPSSGHYLFSGHIHPGVLVSGIGKQSLRFPCFYFTPAFCILPAFSLFTGMALIQQKSGDAVFAIVNQSIVSLQC